MRIGIFGLGAVGGVLAAHLAGAGETVAAVARGSRLAALRERGLTLVAADGARRTVRVEASDDAGDLGPQDAVLVTVKAPALADVAARIGPMLGAETPVVFAMNGVPWWYFYKLAGPHEGRRIELVDPGGTLWANVGPERAIGCVVNAPAAMPEPGVVIARNERCEFILGEPDNTSSARVKRIAAALEGAGLGAPVTEAIRREMWNKLFGNMVLGPMAALTLADSGQLMADAALLEVARRAMEEGQRVANRLGEDFAVDFAKRLAIAAGNPAHKQSMLQDLERGSPLEIDALVRAVCELGDLVEVETPTMDTILALVAQRARVLGLYGG